MGGSLVPHDDLGVPAGGVILAHGSPSGSFEICRSRWPGLVLCPLRGLRVGSGSCCAF